MLLMAMATIISISVMPRCVGLCPIAGVVLKVVQIIGCPYFGGLQLYGERV